MGPSCPQNLTGEIEPEMLPGSPRALRGKAQVASQLSIKWQAAVLAEKDVGWHRWETVLMQAILEALMLCYVQMAQ